MGPNDTPLAGPLGSKEIWIEMRVRTMRLNKNVHPLRADRYFNPLDGVHQQEAEFPIKDVKV